MVLTDQQFQTLYPVVMGWITQTLAASSPAAQPISSKKFSRLPLYFRQEVLASAKIVVVDALPIPPLSKIGLTQFSDFERGDFDAITYLDTFFVRRHRSNDEGLHFHELVHVVQWKLLGPERFLEVYATGLEMFGYRNSPLEVMAYDAEQRFRADQLPFDVEKFVVEQLRQLKISQ
jgi:hypothetical protein